MAKILFPLRNVSDDEAQAVRELLDEHGLDWYETPAGNWGISNHAIWLKNQDDWVQARDYIDKFQLELNEKAQLNGNTQADLLSFLLEKPWKFLLAVAGIAVVIYFSIRPFFGLLE